MIFVEHHPYWHVANIVKNSEISELHFSYYTYRPQSLIDERKYFSLSREVFLDVSSIWKVVEKCPADSELALHSTVILKNGDIRHIPMIDMSSSSKAHINRLGSYIEPNLFESFSWYSSGRSFHGYGGILVRPDEWMKLMGILLLANQKNLAPIVDPRWIGHRLIAGYSALRWTRNTDFYIYVPKALSLS